jgi:murein DD-endopeptidase MepM/ murein hydrolase activator NlpD
MLKGGKILAGCFISTMAMVFGFIVLSTVVAEITRQQLPWGKDKVRDWMLGTPQPVARELEDNGFVHAGIGVGWEGYVHPTETARPRGIPFDFTPRLNCYFQDPDYPRHTGVDFPEGEGTPVITTMAGLVVWAAPNGPWGNLVVIENDGYQTWYAHLNDFAVAQGDVVSQGQRIGSVGNNGNSTGFHLHYGIKKRMGEEGAVWVDPLGYFDGADYTKVPCR